MNRSGEMNNSQPTTSSPKACVSVGSPFDTGLDTLLGFDTFPSVTTQPKPQPKSGREGQAFTFATSF